MAQKHAKIGDSEALQIVNARCDVDGQQEFRRPVDKQVLRNRAFFFGKHHWYEDPRTGFMKEPLPASHRRTLYKAPLMDGNILRSVLTVAGASGEFVVPPKKSTRIAEKAAWVSTKLFEHISELNDMVELDELACLIAALDGTVIWKVSWDPERGDPKRFYYPERTQGRLSLIHI